MATETTPLAASPSRVAAWLALAHCTGAGPVLLKRAVQALGSPELVLGAATAQLAQVEGIGSVRAAAIIRSASTANTGALLERCAQHGISVLCTDDADWPPGFRHIPDPPIVLYVRGRWRRQDLLAVAVVGARRCTLYGREQAGKFAAALAEAGVTIISGGARGIDTAAHEGALRGGGRTVVVQGCGLEYCYPSENVGLYDRIVREDRGAVFSELPLDQPPLPENFPPRNRIIAALALGVLVVEANLRSGSLITARLAADDYGREVFALPGRVDSATSSGTHHLIKTGAAALVENVEDILRGIGQGELVDHAGTQRQGPRDRSGDTETRGRGDAASHQHGKWTADTGNQKQGTSRTDPTAMTVPQRKIFDALGREPLDVDSLCENCALPASVVVAELTFLQIRGLVRRGRDQRYALRN